MKGALTFPTCPGMMSRVVLGAGPEAIAKRRILPARHGE